MPKSVSSAAWNSGDDRGVRAGILLILGISIRLAAVLTGMLTFAFAAAMTLVQGVHAPLIYSVFPFSAARFFLRRSHPTR